MTSQEIIAKLEAAIPEYGRFSDTHYLIEDTIVHIKRLEERLHEASWTIDDLRSDSDRRWP